MPNKKKTILFVIIAAIVIAVAVLVVRFLETKEDEYFAIDTNETDVFEGDVNLIRYNGKWYKQNPDLKTLLLIGVDSFEDSGKSAKQSDFLLLVAIDSKNKNYKALQLNRDTMADVPQLDIYGEEYVTANQQLALAFAHSEDDLTNCKNTVKAVSNLLYGIDIEHFLCVPMDIVASAADMVGGVPVFVEDDFSNVDPSIVKGETVNLTGEHALNFVRARGSMDEPTNIARMQRQRVFINSLHKQAVAKANSDTSFVVDSLLDLSTYITSDCTINQLSELFDVALETEPTDILTIKGDVKAGTEYVEFYVDEEALQKQIIDLFFIED